MEPQPNYYKRRIAAIFVFAVVLLFIGRHLTFLPKIELTKSENEKLKNGTQNIIKDKPGFYSVYYKDFITQDSFGIDEHQIETGASVNKVPIIAVLYYLANKGEIKLDDRISVQKDDIQDYGTGSIRYQKLPATYSYRNLAKLALQQSDNTAAHVISLKLGPDKIQKLVSSWGMKQTIMAANKTTAYDMSIVYEKIYKNEITDSANTKELLEFMTDTDIEDRLPKDLPKNIKVYHKSGDGEGFVHDVGIIGTTEEGAYYLGIMTSDIGNNEQKTKDTIAQISKKIFDTINF